MHQKKKIIPTNHDGKNATSSAFTLIELMIAIALLSMLLSMIQVVLISTISARDTVQAQTHVDRVGAKLLGLIGQDIQAAYIYQLEGVSFLGKSNRYGSKIDFISNRDSLLSSREMRSDLCELGYFVRPNPQEPGALKLMRREDFFIDDKPMEGGYAIKLYDRVAAFDIRYVDRKKNIVKHWNSKRDKGLPKAVIVTIGLRSAPRNSAPEVLGKSIRYFKACILITASSNPPHNQKKKKKDPFATNSAN